MITWCFYAESDFNFSLSTWTFHSFILLNSSNRRDHPPILVHNTIYSTWRQLRFLYPTTFLPPLYLLLVPPSNISGDLILLRFSLSLSLLRCFTCTGETPLCHFSTIPESASPSIHPQNVRIPPHTKPPLALFWGCVYFAANQYLRSNPQNSPPTQQWSNNKVMGTGFRCHCRGRRRRRLL